MWQLATRYAVEPITVLRVRLDDSPWLTGDLTLMVQRIATKNSSYIFQTSYNFQIAERKLLTKNSPILEAPFIYTFYHINNMPIAILHHVACSNMPLFW